MEKRKGGCTGQMVSEMIWMVKLVMVSSGNDSLVIVQSSSSKSVECYPAGHSWLYSCDLDLSAI